LSYIDIFQGGLEMVWKGLGMNENIQSLIQG